MVENENEFLLQEENLLYDFLFESFIILCSISGGFSTADLSLIGADGPAETVEKLGFFREIETLPLLQNKSGKNCQFEFKSLKF